MKQEETDPTVEWFKTTFGIPDEVPEWVPEGSHVGVDGAVCLVPKDLTMWMGIDTTHMETTPDTCKRVYTGESDTSLLEVSKDTGIKDVAHHYQPQFITPVLDHIEMDEENAILTRFDRGPFYPCRIPIPDGDWQVFVAPYNKN